MAFVAARTKGPALGPKRMIDGRRFDQPRPCGHGEQQEGQAVRPPGNCDSDARIRLDERVEIAAKAFD